MRLLPSEALSSREHADTYVQDGFEGAASRQKFAGNKFLSVINCHSSYGLSAAQAKGFRFWICGDCMRSALLQESLS